MTDKKMEPLDIVVLGGIYQHFRTKNFYKVTEIAKHSETLERMVVYHSLKTPQDPWVRPISMFAGKVTEELTGKEVFRFALVADSEFQFAHTMDPITRPATEEDA